MTLAEYQHQQRQNNNGQTLGESRMQRTTDEMWAVDLIKHETANLIDRVSMIREGQIVLPERERVIALAQTHYETAAMYAAKAATI